MNSPQNCENTNKVVDKALQLFKKRRKVKETAKKPKVFDIFRRKRGYVKLTPEKLATLEARFSENKYPEKREFQAIAEEIHEKAEKIENWFKQRRRKHVFAGKMAFEKKKVFSKEQQQILMQAFLANQRPSQRKCENLAKELQCHTKSVKNWFIYKRKLATELPTLDILKTFCEEPRETEKIPEQTPQFQANTCNFLENHANPLNFLENPHDFLGISKEISKQWLEHALFLQNMAKVQHFCASFWQTPWIFANFLAELAIKRENLENSQ